MAFSFHFFSRFFENIKGIQRQISDNFPSEIEIMARNIVETSQDKCDDYTGSRIVPRQIRYQNDTLDMTIDFADSEAVDYVIDTIKEYMSIMNAKQRDIFESQLRPLEGKKEEMLSSNNQS